MAAMAAREPQPTLRPRIALGLTVLREVDAKLHVRWMNVLRSHWWPGAVYNGRSGFGAAMARNNVLKQFFEDHDNGIEHDALLFWDSDQVPPLIVPGPLSWNGTRSQAPWQGGYFTEYLQWLIEEEPTKQVIGGLYFSREAHWDIDKEGKVRGSPHDPIAYWSPTGDGYRHLTPQELVPMLQRPALYHVHAVGTGSMLIRKELLLRLRELKKPRAIFEAPMIGARAEQRHFELVDELLAELGPEGDAYLMDDVADRLKDLRKWMEGQGGGDAGSQFTEDVFFCDEVQKRLNEWIWLDTAMQSAHIAELWITSRHYLEANGFSVQPHPQSMRSTQEVAKQNSGRIWVPGGKN